MWRRYQFGIRSLMLFIIPVALLSALVGALVAPRPPMLAAWPGIVEFSPNGQLVAAETGAGEVAVWDLSSGTPRRLPCSLVCSDEYQMSPRYRLHFLNDTMLVA